MARAQAGRYHRIEINRGLPARNLVRYFDHDRRRLDRQSPRSASSAHFRQANLCGTAAALSTRQRRFDVIFLRNVMLYFAQDTRRTLLAGIHRLLAPDGILFLGSSEQPADPSHLDAVLAGGTCHFRPRLPS